MHPAGIALRGPTRLVRYADDFVGLVHGTRDHTAAVRKDVAAVLAPLGLRLSPTKTRIVHMSDGLDFLGFHIQWQRKRGSNRWHVHTFIAARPIRSLKANIRALTRRTSQQDLRTVLTRLNQVTHGWAKGPPQTVHHADRQVAAHHRGRDRAPTDSGHPGDPLPATHNPHPWPTPDNA
ncbi:reverse transcriptase domain-containing protein [Micromonospora olivasterospora]|uniref:Group II intron maturase n=1 Tax=Micromonospora olivasterospora TaxID=1880 RepID=A0A562I8Y4_MICOL|nr:reverse transcriptase domain-containing protein [Micromonospora olivasterospora]TWH67185.1 group II intron maturase [Micromonospora olivasterospora]